MNVLILGGAARLGPYVVRALEGEHTLRVTDILPLETTHEFQRVDIGSPEDVHRASEGMDAIVNCSVVREDRQAAFDVNTRGCYNMMRAAVAHGIPRVLNTGAYFTIEGDSYTRCSTTRSAPTCRRIPARISTRSAKGWDRKICKVFTENSRRSTCLRFLFFSFRDHDEAGAGEQTTPLPSPGEMPRRQFGWVLTVELTTLPVPLRDLQYSLADLPHQRFSCEKNKRLLGFTPQDRLEATWRR